MTLNGHPEFGDHDPDLEGEFFKLIGPIASEVIDAANDTTIDSLPAHYAIELFIPTRNVRTIVQALGTDNGPVLGRLLGDALIPLLQQLLQGMPILWREGTDIDAYTAWMAAQDDD